MVVAPLIALALGALIPLVFIIVVKRDGRPRRLPDGYQLRGGAWIGPYKVSWPFARATLTSERLTIRVRVPRIFAPRLPAWWPRWNYPRPLGYKLPLSDTIVRRDELKRVDRRRSPLGSGFQFTVHGGGMIAFWGNARAFSRAAEELGWPVPQETWLAD